jgi:hypothetical protein
MTTQAGRSGRGEPAASQAPRQQLPARLARGANRDLLAALLAAVCCVVVVAVVLVAAALRVGSWLPVLAGGGVFVAGLALALAVVRSAGQGRVR